MSHQCCRRQPGSQVIIIMTCKSLEVKYIFSLLQGCLHSYPCCAGGPQVNFILPEFKSLSSIWTISRLFISVLYIRLEAAPGGITAAAEERGLWAVHR